MRIVVLASCGRHPGSGRARVAPSEARALALAASLGAEIDVLHAGPAGIAQAALSDALGMGAARLTVLDIAEGSDPLPVLIAALRSHSADIILAGAQAEQGEGSGFLPYAIAEALGAALITAVTAASAANGEMLVTQAVAGGRRRQIAAAFPLMLTVDAKGPAPKLAAIGKIRRGTATVTPISASADERLQWQTRLARPRPKRLSAPKTGGAPEHGKRILRDLDAEAAAQAILDYLQQEGLARPSDRVS